MHPLTLHALQAAQKDLVLSNASKQTALHLSIKNALFASNPHVFSSTHLLAASMMLPSVARNPQSRQILSHLDAVALQALFPRLILNTMITTWRLSKRVYTFDEAFFEVLTRTPSVSSLPGELLLRLPDWGFFVELPQKHQLATRPGNIVGFFVHVDAELKTTRSSQHPSHYSSQELILLGVRREEDLFKKLPGLFELHSAVYHLSFLNQHGEINASLSLRPGQDLAELQSFNAHTGEQSDDLDDVLNQPEFLRRMLNVLLYLCSVKADYQRPAPPTSRSRTRHDYHPASHLQHVQVGYRLGAALGAARKEHENHALGSGQAVSPHIRSPHWHLYWTGPRSGPKTPVVHWMPPIPVNMEWGEDVLPSSHPVRPASQVP